MSETLYWIEGPWPGKFAIALRPRGGERLEDDIHAWSRAGLSVILSMLTEKEAVELGLTREAELCRAAGLEFVSFPAPDGGVPASADANLELLRELESNLGEGKGVAVHCWQSIGRSGLIAACLLTLSGLDPRSAIRRVSLARRFPIPQTLEQEQWIMDFSRSLASASPRGSRSD